MRYHSAILTILAITLLAEAAPKPLDTTSLGSKARCTNPRLRREWRSLSVLDRKKYIKAVQCMMEKPPKYQKNFPVVRNRYDDFVALHVNASLAGEKQENVGFPGQAGFEPASGSMPPHGAHDSGDILPWHRYTISLWEDALISECNWHGGVPYWNWYLDTPDGGGAWLKSPIWDPETGFGGNGEKVNVTSQLPGFSSGTGGGCVKDGPFKDYKIGIGPFGKMTANNTIRCLTRDLNPRAIEKYGGKSKLRVLTGAKTFQDFMNVMSVSLADGSHEHSGGKMPGGMDHGNTQGVATNMGHGNTQGAPSNVGNGNMPGAPQNMGHGNMPGAPQNMGHGNMPFGPPSGWSGEGEFPDLHAVGHGSIGGEMLDPMNSVNEPLFWLHHSAIDYFWFIWQEQDPKNRVYDLAAGKLKDPTKSAGDQVLEMGVFALSPRVKQMADSLNRDGTGLLCVKYEGLPVKTYQS